MAIPDIFTNVHKGLRRGLFETAVALGREVNAATREQLRAVLHFVRHHGDNEDSLLLPRLAVAAPHLHARMQAAHARIEDALTELAAHIDDDPDLYHRTNEFIALYLEHMREEEIEIEPGIRAALTIGELEAIARENVARTAPDDARMMLGWMLPAMPLDEANAMRTRLPPGLL